MIQKIRGVRFAFLSNLKKKGFQIELKDFRLVHHIRTSARKALAVTKTQEKREIFSDRVVVESYFEHVTSIFAVFSPNNCCDEPLHNRIFKFYLPWINFHIKHHSLRKSGG